MFSPYQFWMDLGSLLISPKQLFFGGLDLLSSWMFTRQWNRLLFVVPILLITGFIIGCSLFVSFQGPEVLLSNYWSAIEKANRSVAILHHNSAVPKDSQEARSLPATQTNNLIESTEITAYSSSLLRKVLELDSSDNRANYLVAFSLASQGRLSQARQLMRKIAPEEDRGFLPAHAWLAADRIQKLGLKEKRDLAQLVHDLEQARRWPNVSPVLMSYYADLLLRENRNNDAIEVLREAGKNDSRVQVKLAQLAKSLGNDRLFEEIKKELEGPREARVQNGTATEFEFGELISLVLMQGNTSKAIQLARTGLREYPQSAQLKRLLSNAYMMEFSVASETKATSEERMALLDLAMKSDPTNPLVLEKIAELVSQDKLHNENIAAFLRDQLASGNATATTHLFLAVGHLRKEQLEQAIVHLEIAVGLAPNNPIILNNLALCLARTRPSELPRAKKMIEFGLQIGGPNAELLDTYGEILVLGTDYISAIRAFEAALSINQDRPATRKRLAEAYTKVALTEMAESVSKFDSKESSTLLNPDGTVNKKSLLEESPFEKSK